MGYDRLRIGRGTPGRPGARYIVQSSSGTSRPPTSASEAPNILCDRPTTPPDTTAPPTPYISIPYIASGCDDGASRHREYAQRSKRAPGARRLAPRPPPRRRNIRSRSGRRMRPGGRGYVPDIGRRRRRSCLPRRSESAGGSPGTGLIQPTPTSNPKPLRDGDARTVTRDPQRVAHVLVPRDYSNLSDRVVTLLRAQPKRRRFAWLRVVAIHDATGSSHRAP